ncbi:PepSY domain-containing protein [Clostridium sp. CS001]|uniref:YcdB/YcdC domain-containing protein n=1 Tax=Clostridium sp. CS001 TaxID=2880648 RepID=UPI001CF4A682|nr:YcdB/YcdC domain-containing protein [Clostridium sp. CS001]MCB2288509.1 PepSY domain-containing protein [Clostridium sp. CS001]
MRNKRIFSIVLSAMISFGATLPSYAQNAEVKSITANSASVEGNLANENNAKISKDDAKKIAKKALSDYLDITIDETQYQTNVNFSPNYRYATANKDYIWQISWNSNSQNKSVNINISVDANSGKIINIDNYTYNNSQSVASATLTEDKAKEIGESFLNKINLQEFPQCKLIESSEINNGMRGDLTGYNFTYYRTVNGIPFLGNYLTVGVDGVTGKISSYSIMWSDSQVPEIPKDVILPQDKANQILKDNLKLQLKYILVRDENGMSGSTQNLKLVYMIDSSTGTNIDAKDGKMLDVYNTELAQKKVRNLDATQKKAFIDSYKPLQKLSKELDNNSAEAIMKQIVQEIYGDSYDIQSINYQKGNIGFGPTVNCWSGQFNKKGVTNGFGDQGNVQIDSLTGQLMSLYKYNPYGDMTGASDVTVQPKLTWEQSYDKAISIVQKYLPDKVKDMSTEQTYFPSTSYYNNIAQVDRNYGFYFNRLINGISYQNDNISIQFDTITGEITNLNSSWADNFKIPSAAGIMSAEDAQKIFFAKYTPKLAYLLINTSKDLKNPVMEAKLVYSLESGMQYSQFSNIDSTTRNFVDYNGQEIDNNFTAFKTKIKGSPQEKELNLLASQRIISTKDFDLSKKVSRLDLIKMLVNVKGYRYYMSNDIEDLKINYGGEKGDETYNYLQQAVSYGILENSGDFKGDEIITREEMIKYIVKLAGYDKLAKAKDTFIVKYSDASDITPENLGYIAISRALGFANATDNKFKPKDKVIISDAAVSIYKVLDIIRNSRGN